MNFKILIVDDIKTNLLILENLLKEIENKDRILDIIQVSNGQDAIKIAHEDNKIELIILDIQMPNMNGFEVAKLLKANSKTKDIPIIFITATFKEKEFIEHGYKMGAIDYFTKPIEKHQFLNKIILYLSLFEKNHQLKVSMNQNIKHLRTLQEQSRLAQLGEMISMIAHQWGQPLSAISSVALDMKINIELENYDFDNLKSREKYLKDTEQKISRISDLTQNLTKIINDFKNFFKPDNKVVSHHIEQSIYKALKIIKESLEDDNIQIIENYTSSKTIDIYEGKVAQVLLSIIKNAQENFNIRNIKDPKIWINTKDTEDGTIISFLDNGGGIDKDILPNIFDPYFSTKMKKNGTGLGLYMSKTIIEKHHNAKFSAKNKFDGACFEITFFSS